MLYLSMPCLIMHILNYRAMLNAGECALENVPCEG